MCIEMQYYMYVYLYIFFFSMYIYIYGQINSLYGCTRLYVYIHMYVSVCICPAPSWGEGWLFFELLGNGVFCFVPLCQPIQFPTHTAQLYKVMNLASRYFKDTNVYNNRIATISCVYQHITPCCGNSFFPTPQLEGGGGMATAAKGFVQPPPEVWSFLW